MSVLSAPLVSPTAAVTFYGTSTTHSSSFTGISGFSGYPPEIVETARALKNNPDLIYEFVHNQIEVEYAFGLRKGPLGALIDRSGTPFDQNVLFVELVRQAGYQAQYQIGQVTIAEADFANWTGVSDIQAACRLLAAGGIPATFNGQSSWPFDCSQTGTFTSVTILHVWSQVNIGGTWYAYDPSFKSHTSASGVNLMSTSGLVAGQTASQAASTVSSGTASGSNYIVNASEANLDSYLQARGAQALADLKTNEPSWDTNAVVGITKIVPTYAPSGGWRNAAPTGYTVGGGAITITGDIPDQYRCTLTVSVFAFQPGVVTILNHLFYVDDIAGRRLGMLPNFVQGSFAEPPSSGATQSYSLMLDDVAIATYSCSGSTSYPCPFGMYGGVTLSATHPYAANSGTYGAQTMTEDVSTLSAPFAIVSGWGSASSALSAKWGREGTEDRQFPAHSTAPYPCVDGTCWETSALSAGDLTQQKLAASWLGQMSRMLAIQARLGSSKADHQHTIGIVTGHGQMSVFQYPAPPNPNAQTYYGIADQFTTLDVDTAISVTSTVNDFTRRNAVARSIALAAATLEASVIEQSQDLPDTASTATRFAWGDQPDNEDPCFATTTPRPFYDFTGSTSGSRASLYLYEGSANGCSAAPSTPAASPAGWEGLLENAIASYLGAGFNVTASAESFLGPGARFGPAHAVPGSYNDPSVQRGGALVATQYDGSGNVLQVAHVIAGWNGISKGGAGAPPARFAEYDPSKAAEVLKDRFVDRSVALGVDLKTGTVGYTTPTLLSVGGKSPPYGLEANLTFKAGFRGCQIYTPCIGPVQGGWNHNWDIRFTNTGSGNEALGDTSPQAAAGTLVAFLAMQDVFYQSGLPNYQKDVYATLAADWWRQQMVANVATVNRAFSAEQYVRLVDGTWLAPIGSPGALTESGSRTKTRDYCLTTSPGVSGNADYSSSARRWDFSTVSFTLRHAGGDVMSYAPWKWNYDIDNFCAYVYGYKPTTWTFPQGPSITFTYDFQYGVTGVTTSLGRSMTFTGLQTSGLITATSGSLTVGQQGTSGAVTGIADAAGDTYKFDYTSALARSATQRPVPYPLLVHVYEPVNGSQPALEYDYDTRGLIDQAKDADALQLGTHGPYSWFIAEGGRGERDDPGGGAYTVYFDTDGNAVRHIDELGREVDSVYDGRHRVTSRTFPELDQELFGYDANDNATSLTRVPKPCPTPPNGCVAPSNIVVSASYDPTWNKLASVTDALGNVTNLSYYGSGNGASMLQQVQRPAIGGVRPTYTFQYSSIGLLTQSVDAAGYTTTHGYDSSGNLTSTTEGAAAVGSNPALNLTTTFTPDAVGNVIAVTDPRGNSVTTQFDNLRRKTDDQSRNGGTSATPLAVSHFVYDANSRVTSEQHASALDGSGNPTAWATTTTAYSPTGKVIQLTDPVGNITQTSYDALDRAQCVAVRMNPAAYGSLPSSACTLGTAGSYGSDRITETTYDLAGQTTSMIRALGDPLQETYESFGYGADGEQLSITDSVGNKTGYAYDAFNRLIQTTFPSTSRGAGTTDSSDYEAYSYDANGNRLTLRKRDGNILSWCYDVLDRETEKYLHSVAGCGSSPPAPTGNDVVTAYDLAGRTSSALFASGQGVTYSFDAAGRTIHEVTNGQSLGFGYDAASDRTSLTWPDGFAATYAYDALNRVSSIGDTNGDTFISAITYDPLGRRISLIRTNATSTAYGYDLDGHLTSLSHTFTNQTSSNQSYTFTYNPAGQDLSSSFTNAVYAWTNHPLATTSKTYDGLNRDAAIAAVGSPCGAPGAPGGPFGYDCNGNLTDTGTNGYTYDIENRLASVSTISPSTTLETLSYDPLGRLSQTVTASATTTFLYDGDNLVGEYNASGVLQHRYIHGPGVDEPLVWYNLTGGSVTNWLYADRQGSIIAQSVSAGTVAATYAYGAYGEPQAWGGSRFAYTGQIQLPESQLYHYRARAYDPASGRFLQTDPVGYASDADLYAYVGADPLDRSDPTGETMYVNGTGENQSLADPCTGSLVPGSCGPEPVTIFGGVPGAPASGGSGDAHASSPKGGAPASQAAADDPIPGIGHNSRGAGLAPEGEEGCASAPEVCAIVIAAGSTLTGDTPTRTPVERIIQDHMSLRDLTAARRELRGEVVARRWDGKPFDHVQEVRDAQNGLLRQIRVLRQMLGESGYSSPENQAYIRAQLSIASKALDFSEQFVPRP